MPEPERFEEVFQDLSWLGRSRLPAAAVEQVGIGELDQLESFGPSPVDDELIVGEDYVTYLLFPNDCDLSDFSLVTSDGYIDVTFGDHKVRRALAVPVDGDHPSPEYKNGVLAVRLRRLPERDGGA